MGEALDPTPWHRLLALRPDWTRTVAARRAAAGALVLLAAAAALRPDPADGRVDVVVAARDLSAGSALTDSDVRIETHSATTVPDGAQRDPAALVGITLAGPARRGEVLTDVRVLGPRLTGAAAGPDARIVALDLADPALLDVVRTGDVVDVLATAPVPPGDGASPVPRILATDAVVVTVSERSTSPTSGSQRVVLVALPARAATEVAGASLTQAITLTLR